MSIFSFRGKELSFRRRMVRSFLKEGKVLASCYNQMCLNLTTKSFLFWSMFFSLQKIFIPASVLVTILPFFSVPRARVAPVSTQKIFMFSIFFGSLLRAYWILLFEFKNALKSPLFILGTTQIVVVKTIKNIVQFKLLCTYFNSQDVPHNFWINDTRVSTIAIQNGLIQLEKIQ